MADDSKASICDLVEEQNPNSDIETIRSAIKLINNTMRGLGQVPVDRTDRTDNIKY